MNNALGLVEAIGANPVVKAADAMCKAAAVELVAAHVIPQPHGDLPAALLG